MAGIDYRRVGDDAVGHAARGYVGRIVADVGQLGGCLRLIVTEDQSSPGGR